MKNLTCKLAGLLALVFLASPAPAQTVIISNLWSISTSDGRVYVSATAFERGVAYNPLNNHAYIVSRNTGLRVAIVDGDTGAELGFLNVTGVGGGTFALSQIGVADDGLIYAANLTTGSGTTAFRVYCWTNETDPPRLVFDGNPSTSATVTNSHRYGDAIDVRGGGTNTQIIATASGVAFAAILRPVDDTLVTFTNTLLAVSGLGGAGDLTKGVAFGPTNTFYGKNSGTPNVRLCRFDLAAGTAAVIASYATVNGLTAIGADTDLQVLAGVETTNGVSAHNLRVYDVSGATAVLLASTNFPAPATANANVVGGIDVNGGRIIAVDTANGVLMQRILVDTNPVPPSITLQPANTTIVQGGYGTLTAAASGTKPLFYQWLFGGNPIADATNTTLNLTNVTLASAGNYSVVVTNSAGSTNSTAGVVTISPAARTPALEKIWQLPPGSRFFLANDGTQRGLAYNAVNGHVLVASRAPTNGIHVLDGETGAYLHSLQMDNALITGGVITLNLVGCTVDGQVFAGNVVLDGANATTPFKLYTWLNDDPTTAPTLAWSGDPGSGTTNRWGDTMDVRGTFDNPEILVGSRFGVQTAIIPVAFGTGATPQTFTHGGVPGAAFGLGIAFGRGDTIWGKTAGGPLVQVLLDYGTFGSTLLRSNFNLLPNFAPIQVAIEEDLLAAVSPLETPDNVRLYDVADTNAAPAALDTEFFPTDNSNVNGTGALAFGPCRLYALDSNNGLVAFRVAPILRSSVSGGMLSLSWTVGALQSTTDVGDPNSWTNVPSATTPYPVNTTSPGRAFFRLQKAE